MTIFRESQSESDRSSKDRSRHKHLIKKAIKENISDIISEHSIIGKKGNKKIRIPVKGLKEYRFIFGKENKGVGQGNGKIKRGDKIRVGDKSKKQGGAGSEKGEDIYETEVTIDELINILFEDLQLPNLERKKLKQTITKSSKKILGYKRKGIPPHLAKRKSIINKIKRKKASKWEPTEEEPTFPWNENDLRYRKRKLKVEYESNAVVFFIMDVSGSMTTMKKYLARSFCFLLYRFLLNKYENVHKVFIAHTTEGKEVNEDEFFHKGESGGTFISSGFEKMKEIIYERYHPDVWNIYAIECSDGENFEEDNEKTVKIIKELCEISNLIGFCEIRPLDTPPPARAFFANLKIETIYNFLNENLKSINNFELMKVQKKEDIWLEFAKFLRKDQNIERKE